jgi:pseudouridine kinase
MTQREEEILDHIKSNPLITQQELADILGIERSSVAVHISNLSKKGIIKGKGYIIESQKYVLVIGGSNMDILGTPQNKLIHHDSNPGIITTSPGGVGRNIAQNIALLGMDSKLLSAVGNDLYGNLILEKTGVSGVDMHFMKISNTHATSTYLSILDHTGDMAIALSDMSITEEIDIAYIKKNEEIIKKAEIVVLDTNLSQDTLDYLIHNFPKTRFIIDTVSSSKARKIKNLLNNLYCIKPNLVEAEVLLDMTISTDEDIHQALLGFQKVGIENPMITLGKRGVAFLHNEQFLILPTQKVNIINANGAGDAFTAGITYGFFHKKNLRETITIGSLAAKTALESKDTVNLNLSIHSIIQQL